MCCESVAQLLLSSREIEVANVQLRVICVLSGGAQEDFGNALGDCSLPSFPQLAGTTGLQRQLERREPDG
jgi:hypothetical protein